MRRFETSTERRPVRIHRVQVRAVTLLLALALLAGCGSDDSGSGGSGGSQTTVVISPTALALVLNQSQTFSALVSGAPTVDIVATNGAVRASNVVTVTTTAAHNLAVGQSVTITGTSIVNFSGVFTVASVPSSTTFTFSQVGTDTSSNGGRVANTTVKWFVNDTEGGSAALGTITTAGVYTAPAALPPPLTATITATGAARASNVVTITTSAAHNFFANTIVQIVAVTDTSFNGTFVIASVPSTTTFTYNQANTNATSGAGTATVNAVRIKAQSVAVSSAEALASVSIDSGIVVRVSPLSVRVGTGETFPFSATVAGNTNQAVNWFVNDVAGGSAALGTINASGVYTAPTTAPNAVTATVAATGAVRNTNVVTITTTAAHSFVSGNLVQITGVTDASFNGTFAITSVPSTTTFTFSQTGANATSGNGTVTTAIGSVTIRAVSAIDATRSAAATAVVVAAADPTLASITPSTVAQGSVLADVFLTGTDFLSTTIVLVNGSPVATALVDPTIIRARIPENDLASIQTLSIIVQRQSGFMTPAQNLTVEPVRPALVGTSPDSAAQGGAGAVTLKLNGGFYSPSVVAEFDGQTRSAQPPVTTATIASSGAVRNSGIVTIATTAVHSFIPGQTVQVSGVADASFVGTFSVATVPSAISFTYLQAGPTATSGGGTATTTTSTRQLDMTLNPGDLAVAGLFTVGVRNSSATPQLAAVNLAVQPSATPNLTATVSLGAGLQPAAVAVNTATGIAVIANRGGNSISLVDLATNTPSGPFAVGTSPTGVGVDNERNLAVVANNGSDNISVVNLASGAVTATIPSPTPSGAAGPAKPFAVAVNSIAGLALVANQTTNTATVIDLTTIPPSLAGTITGVGTGANPQVAVEPRLNWGVVTPGGAGSLTIVDLGRRTVVATVSAGQGIRGIAINTETGRALVVDPGSANALIFSVLDQTVTSAALELGHTAAAVNPLTDIGVTLNPNTNQARVIDLRTPLVSPNPIAVGTTPRAAAIDPVRNLAVVANEGSNDVSILDLGAIRALHVIEVSPATVIRQATDTTDVTLLITGNGFDATSVVRLDGVAIGAAPTLVSSRRLTVTVPAAMLASARRFALDVENAGTTRSNAASFIVIQAVTVGDAPRAVVIDEQRNVAVVANSGSDNVSVVDLATGTVTATLAVGDNPQGVAVIPRAGLAVVTNRDSGTASILDLVAGTLANTVNVGTQPLGVDINQETGTAVVANNGASSIHVFSAIAPGTADTLTLDPQPFAIAIDPRRNIAAITHAGPGSNNISLVNLAPTLSLAARIPGSQLPTGIAFDPVSDRFLIASSLSNNLLTLNPDTQQLTLARVGINPTSVAYNFNSSTLVTTNSASNTLSVMDFLERRIRAVLPISAAQQFAVAIHPRTNVAVIADEANDRLLLLPLPR